MKAPQLNGHGRTCPQPDHPAPARPLSLCGPSPADFRGRQKSVHSLQAAGSRFHSMLPDSAIAKSVEGKCGLPEEQLRHSLHGSHS